MEDRRELRKLENGALAGLRATVFGRGPLGLMTAFALAMNGVDVQILAASPIELGVGFTVAAGLIEPVATRDPRALRWTQETLRFFRWAETDPAWGVVPRQILFLSDDKAATEQDWMQPLGRRAAAAGDLRGGRAHGCWIDSVVVQPDLALKAVKREIRNLDVKGGAKDIAFSGPVTITSIEEAAARSVVHDSDFFVIATGIGLAKLADVEDLPGMPQAAGLSAGLGTVIRFPVESFLPRLEHVLMDDDELGYLIPQRDFVIGGGTNHLAEHDDPAVDLAPHPALVNEWEAEVRNKIDRLVPGAGDLPGEVRIGARPMRQEVLTHWTESHAIPGLILGGAGGSGWTFSVGIANDVCQVIDGRLGGGGELVPLGGPGPIDPGGLATAA
jgi:glycine/D-amino acid oxidase-like deaminating enzyme